jgi:hypothetical protein
MAEIPTGLTTDEAHRRLAKDGPNVAGLLAAAAALAFVLDGVKLAVFHRLEVS